MCVKPNRMPPKQPSVADENDLTDADRKILDALADGPRTKGAIVDATGLHRNTVGNRLDALSFGEAIECIHDRTALYELANDPRTDGEGDDGESEPRGNERSEVESLRAERDDLESRLKDVHGTQRVDVHAASHALDDLEGALERGDRREVRAALQRARDALEAEED